MVNPTPRTCGVTGCNWSTSENNNTVALVSQEFTDHMATHTLNAALEAMARDGLRQQQQLHPERNGARNVVVKQRNAPSYGKEMEFKEYVKILGEWDEGSLDPPATKQNEVIESLRKLSYRSAETDYLDRNSARVKETQTVPHLIEVLKERFEPTRDQLTESFARRFRTFVPNSREELMAEGDRLATHWKELKIGENPYYFIRRWMSDVGQAHGLISPTEIREMEGGLTGDDEPKWKDYKKKYKTVLLDSNKSVIETNYNNRYRRKDNRSWNDHRSRSRSKSQGRSSSRPRSSYMSESRNDRGKSPERKYSTEEQVSFCVRNIKRMLEDNKEIKKTLEELVKVKKKPVETNFSFNEKTSRLMTKILYNEQKISGQYIVLDSGAPVTCAGEEWLTQHLEHSNLTREDLRSRKVEHTFGFGNGKKINSNIAYDIPIRVKNTAGIEKEIVMTTSMMESMMESSIPLLCGKDSPKRLGGIHSHVDNTLECHNLDNSTFKLVNLSSGHDGLKLEPYQQMTKTELTHYVVNTYLVTEVEGAVDLSPKKVKQVFTEQELRNIHKVSNHKNADSMIEALVNLSLIHI